MNKTATFLLSAATPLVVGLCVATSSSAQTPTSDEAYCRQLVSEYNFSGLGRGFSPQGLDTAVAIAQCREGHARSAIPVLEERLHDDGFDVPPRS